MPLTEEPETILAEDGTVLEQHLYRNLKRSTLGPGVVVLLDNENPGTSARKMTAFEGGEGLTIEGGFYSIGGSSAAKHYTEVHQQYHSMSYDKSMEIRRKREQDAYEREERRKQELHDLEMEMRREELAKKKSERERSERKRANAPKWQRAQPEHGSNSGYGYGTTPGFRATQAHYGQPTNGNSQPWAQHLGSTSTRPTPLNSQSASRVAFPEPHPAAPPMPRAQTDSQVINSRAGGSGFTSQNWQGNTGGEENMDEDDESSDALPDL